MDRHITAIVSGIIQGVGFRPFCSRLARETGLGGSVRNTADGVRIDLFGPRGSVDSFLERLRIDCPTLGHIQSIEVLIDEPAGADPAVSFSILKSDDSDENLVLIPPDIATCDDCLREMRDPGDRRYRYPFINCTNCGPRFTIITDLPYDRPMTTMSPFPLCDPCVSEYKDPENRRFHAQPVACASCGPNVTLLDKDGSEIAKNEQATEKCISFLAEGGIAAIKGLGGFHIACLPDDGPVAELRKRKQRPHKPLALMVQSMEVAERIVRLSPGSRHLLNSPRRPIVVCPGRENSGISGLVAPFQYTIGIMLPYTPLHYLILEKIPALVMTSANLRDAPIISGNNEVIRLLKPVVDMFLVHNREIRMKIDDSVIASAGRRSILLRRGRGFVPHPLLANREMPQILASGAEMKSTFSLTRGKTIFVSQYLGDLKQLETAVFYEKTLRHFIRLFGLRPRFLAADMHPSYPCAGIAKRVIGEPVDIIRVQHHHAHLGACLAENRSDGPAIGVILDGTGLGTDRTSWGGEFLVGDLLSFERAGSFRKAPLPGGDRSVLEPWRFGLSLLEDTLGPDGAISVAEEIWPEMSSSFYPVLSTLPRAPITTSCGRLFDAISALLGVRSVVTYDGQAAIELESSARGANAVAPFDISNENGFFVLDWRPAVRWIVGEGRSMGKEKASAAFHLGLAGAISDIVLEISKKTNVRKVALSGGVWQNRRLLSLAVAMLHGRGLETLIHQSLSPNDECISVGQAVIAAKHWETEIH